MTRAETRRGVNWKLLMRFKLNVRLRLVRLLSHLASQRLDVLVRKYAINLIPLNFVC